MSRLSQAKILEPRCGRIVVSYNGMKIVRYYCFHPLSIGQIQFSSCTKNPKEPLDRVLYMAANVIQSNLPLSCSFFERLFISLFLPWALFFFLFTLLNFLIFFSTLPLYPHPFRIFYIPWKTTSNIIYLIVNLLSTFVIFFGIHFSLLYKIYKC